MKAICLQQLYSCLLHFVSGFVSLQLFHFISHPFITAASASLSKSNTFLSVSFAFAFHQRFHFSMLYFFCFSSPKSAHRQNPTELIQFSEDIKQKGNRKRKKEKQQIQKYKKAISNKINQ